uniref:Uncharacterized protein n=1 Tax=Siphoviridae sp. cthu813 TaxID=2825618 RepID=A0A8S5VI53_9CAUD|nr:MAG TPA: hypothetical protein [Siphoviridae sp. cthu813]
MIFSKEDFLRRVLFFCFVYDVAIITFHLMKRR